LKAGQIVGATPWKQQFMLAIGVIASALVIGPVLDLLFNAYGIAGVYPRAGMDPSQMLAAPQASLMAAVAQGVLMHQLQWGMVGIGAGLALIIVIIDAYLRQHNKRLPALAVGLGIYLPPEIILPVVVGAFLNYTIKKRLKPTLKQGEHVSDAEPYHRGILLACGIVAGSSLMGVILAIPFVIAGNADVLAIVSSKFEPIADVLGFISLISLCWWFLRITRK
jgi:putative OPT family oligopeptide transporter